MLDCFYSLNICEPLWTIGWRTPQIDSSSVIFLIILVNWIEHPTISRQYVNIGNHDALSYQKKLNNSYLAHIVSPDVELALIRKPWLNVDMVMIFWQETLAPILPLSLKLPLKTHPSDASGICLRSTHLGYGEWRQCTPKKVTKRWLRFGALLIWGFLLFF